MPYTPPSHRSPASSAAASPNTSRRSSLSSPRPNLPRSASYLNKHRRTPSVSAVSDGSASPLTPQGTSEDLPGLAVKAATMNTASVRQSPPPRTDDRGMPNGAVISPPDSASSGSDDETTPEIRIRRPDRLKDLRDAVSQLSTSPPPAQPSKVADRKDELAPPSRGMHISFSTGTLGDLGKSGRKVSHVRSVTEPNVCIESAETSISGSEEDTDEDLRKKPQMVRKKSGELVRPALRPSSRRRPSSMPGTPVFSKAVHFDSHLEHVRHFLQVDRPLAVSAGSSPVDNKYESDNEYPFPNEGRSSSKSPPFEWELLTTNFPLDNPIRRTLPAKLEKVWLSADQKTLLGSIAVANLAFQKQVVCRFTLDYWKTTSEVTAEYGHEIRPRQSPLGHDRFTFSVKLADTANLESKTLFFCIRYSVGGEEYWDNNHGANFQVDFKKKHVPQKGKNNFQGASSRSPGGLPRSNRRNTVNSSSLRPASKPSPMDDFGRDTDFRLDEPIHDFLGESGTPALRLKTRSSSSLASDNIAKGLSSPSGAAFANRYDFGASLSAAVQAAKDSMVKDKDALYMKNNVRPSVPPPMASTGSKELSASPVLFSDQTNSGTGSPNISIKSSSYEELVNKYCFVRTPGNHFDLGGS